MFRTLACLAGAMTTTAVVLGWLEPQRTGATLDPEAITRLATSVVSQHVAIDPDQWQEVAIVASPEPMALLAATMRSTESHFRIDTSGAPTRAICWVNQLGTADAPHTIRIEVPQRRHGEPMTLAQWIGLRALVSAIQRSVSLDGHTLPVRLQREWSAVYGSIADFATSSASSS